MTKTLFLTAMAVIGFELIGVAGQSDAPPGAVFTAAQAAAGRVAYESVCVNCHTSALTGRKGEPNELPAVNSLPEEFQKGIRQAGGIIPPLAGPAFAKTWSTRTTQALATRIAVAISGFPPKPLDEQTKFRLAAYFLQMTGASAGTQELGSAGTLDIPVGRLLPSTN